MFPLARDHTCTQHFNITIWCARH